MESGDSTSESMVSSSDHTFFLLHLNSTARSAVETRSLSLPSFPKSTLELKREVQSRFSIPICIQSLSFHSEVLHDNLDLESLHVRSGDTLHLTYLCEGDCDRMLEVTEWIVMLKRGVMELSDDPTSLIAVLRQGVDKRLDEELGIELFDWLKPKAYVNKLFFDQIGGLDVMFQLYSKLLSLKWSSMHWGLKYLECFCTQSLGNFGETFPLRRLLLQKGILEMCVKSLLRVKLARNSLVVDDNTYREDDHGQNLHDHLLQRVIENAVHIVCSLSELRECQLPIASRSDVLEQVICISLSESYPCRTSVLVAEVFLCLGHSPSTHSFLAQREVIEGLLNVCGMRELQNEQLDAPAHLLLVGLKCFTCLAFAQLLLISPEATPPDFHEEIRTYMISLLQKDSPLDIRKYEEEQVCVWETLLPYLNLLFLPNSPRVFPCNALLSELQLLSIETVQFFLHSKIQRENHRDILTKEGLLDFVVCMPWHVPMETRAKAREIVSELSTHIALQPPRLCNIAKAKLAKTCLGLEKVVNVCSVGEILERVHQVM